MKLTITYKLVAVILVIVIPVVIYSIYQYNQNIRNQKSVIIQNNHALADTVASELDHIIEVSQNVMQILEKHPAVKNRRTKECDALFSEILPSHPLYLNILAADMDGYNFCSAIYSTDVHTLRYLDKDWFINGIKGKSYVNDLHVSKLFKTETVMITVPVFDEYEKQVAVLGTPLDFGRVRDLFAAMWKLPPASEIVVVDSKDRIMFCTLHKEHTGKALSEINLFREGMKESGEDEEATGADGIRRLYSFAKLYNAKWRIAVGVPVKEAYAGAYAVARQEFMLILIVCIIAFGMASLISRKISHNVQSLVHGMKEMEAGNFSHRIEISGNDELSDVAFAFNKAIDERYQSNKRLKRVTRILRTLSECNQSLMKAVDEQSLMNEICRIIVEIGGYRFAWVGVVEHDENKSVRPAAQSGYEDGYLAKVNITWADTERGRGPTGLAIRTGKPSFLKNLAEITEFAPWREDAIRRGYVSVIALPLIFGSVTFGALNIYSSEEVDFDEEEMALLQELASDMAYGIMMLRIRVEHDKKEKFIKSVFESMGEGLVVLDPEFRIVSANKAFCEIVGLSEENIINKKCHQIIHKKPHLCCEDGIDCPAAQTFRTGIPGKAVHVHPVKDNVSAYFEVWYYPMKDQNGRVVAVIETLSDITEQRKLEQQLVQAQKMEAVGLLAGGIAHDFNNILTAIIGYSDLINMKMKDEDPLKKKVQNILMSAEKAARLVKNLLAFSRKQESNIAPVRLNEIIANVEKLLRPFIGEDVELTISMTGEDSSVLADTGQIEQVLMNLATNARDAMPEGGHLSITAEIKDLDENFVKEHPDAITGRYAHIAVSDTGKGIPQNVIDKIFEPFFTTKEVGKGTGLGLSIVYGIIKQHKGYIYASSEEGKGSTFNIYLPVMTAMFSDISLAASAGDIIHGNEMILLAEDESRVRDLMKMILEDAGYIVIDAENGEDAVAKFKANNNISAVVLDIVMPRKSGKQAYEEMRQINPAVKALFVSGYPSEMMDEKNSAGTKPPLMIKPVRALDFLKKLRDILDGKA